MVTTKRATAEELAALPDDGFKYDLIRGEIRRMPPAGEDHGRIAYRLARPLFLRAESLGGEVLIAETGYILDRDPDTVLAPDATFIRRADLSPLGERQGLSQVVPALVIEVASPSESMREVLEKVDIYRRAGVSLIWVALPRTKTVLVDGATRERKTLTVDDVLDGGDVLPGLRLPVADVFR